MAFLGNNSMFGHYMLPGNNSASSGFGQGHGSSSFGNSNGHGHGHGSGGFGQDNSHGHEEHGHAIEHGIFNRQHSLLSSMTRSKDDHSQPFVITSLSYPHEYHVTGMSTLYEKPLEKEEKKKLVRQQSISSGDSPHEYKRAPSFSRNPELMRSRTVSSASAPPYGRYPLTKSISIADEWAEPVNMDLARPLLQRRHSIAVDKARKRADSLNRPRKPLLPLNGLVSRMSRKKRSTKSSMSDRDSRTSISEDGSLATPGTERSRSNTLESKISAKSGSGPRNKTPSEKEAAHEKLILSLMNPVVAFDDNVFESQTETEPPVDMNDKASRSQTPLDSNPHENVIESPTMVSKRILHQLQDNDNVSIHSTNSGRFTPRSARSVSSGKSTRRSQSPTQSSSSRTSSQKPKAFHNKLSNDRLDGKLIMYVDPSDSDSSDIYYDCATQDSNSSSSVPINNTGNALIPKRGKRRPMKLARNASTSTCTDGEDTTSTCDSPPYTARSFYPMNQKYNQDYRDELESDATPTEIDESHLTDGNNCETLPLRSFHANQNKTEPKVKAWPLSVRSRPILKQQAGRIDPFSSLISDTDYTSPQQNGLVSDPIQNGDPFKDNCPNLKEQVEIIVPSYVHELKSESDNKDSHGNETGTADSSESGYATSHIHQLSPRDYDKVSHFVNSLPYNPDMEERQSESSHGDVVMNGSETDSDRNDELEEIYPVRSEMSHAVCRSGSDTDNMSIGSNVSISKLEIMKILESPTEVKARIDREMSMKSGKKSPVEEKDEIPNHNSNLRKGSNSSETELLHLFRKETEHIKDNVSEKSTKLGEHQVKAGSMVIFSHDENASMTTTHITRDMGRSVTSFSSKFFDRPLMSYRSEYLYETKFTKCIDITLHILNVLLCLASAGVIAVGIWLLMKDFGINHVTEILENNLMQVIVYISIGAAGISLLAAICLYCGVRQDKVGLGFYAIVLVGVVIAFGTAAVLSAIFVDKLSGVEYRFEFKYNLIEKYGVQSETALDKDYFTTSWDTMQKEFECCGAEGGVNGTDSWAAFRESIWYRNHPSKATIYVPESCCVKNRNIQICQGSDPNLLGPPRYTPDLGKHFRQVNSHLNTDGCYDLFASYLTNLATWAAIALGALAGLYFLVVTLTWVFCFKKYQDYDDSYYDDSDIEMDEHEEHAFNEHEKNAEEINAFSKNAMNSKRKNSKCSSDETQLMIPLKKDNPKSDIKETPSISTPMRKNSKSDIEETQFMSTPTASVHKENSLDKDLDKVSEMEIHKTKCQPHGNGRVGNYQYRKPIESKLDYDSDSSGSESSHSDRRDRWMMAAGGAHLLSIAIEEEDSNFEDSADENSAYV